MKFLALFPLNQTYLFFLNIGGVLKITTPCRKSSSKRSGTERSREEELCFANQFGYVTERDVVLQTAQSYANHRQRQTFKNDIHLSILASICSFLGIFVEKNDGLSHDSKILIRV